MSAAGVLNSLTKDYVRPGQVVIDVSINWDANKPNAKGGLGGIAGDACFAEVEPVVDAITPVPGGRGQRDHLRADEARGRGCRKGLRGQKI